MSNTFRILQRNGYIFAICKHYDYVDRFRVVPKIYVNLNIAITYVCDRLDFLTEYLLAQGLLKSSLMNFLDLLIIYLACGSPFGVYQSTRKETVFSLMNFLIVTSRFLFWPFYAFQMLIGLRDQNQNSSESIRISRIEEIRTNIERQAFSNSSISKLFEFRELYYRYTGLSQLIKLEPSHRISIDLFEISGHRNKSLATICLSRRNAKRIRFHQLSAQQEFADFISLNSHGTNLVDLALKLVNEFADNQSNGDTSEIMKEIVKSSRRQIFEPDLSNQESKKIPKSNTRKSNQTILR